jgi:hypothetical protein
VTNPLRKIGEVLTGEPAEDVAADPVPSKMIDEKGSDEHLPDEALEEIERQLAETSARDRAEEAVLAGVEPADDPDEDPDTEL